MSKRQRSHRGLTFFQYCSNNFSVFFENQLPLSQLQCRPQYFARTLTQQLSVVAHLALKVAQLRQVSSLLQGHVLVSWRVFCLQGSYDYHKSGRKASSRSVNMFVFFFLQSWKKNLVFQSTECAGKSPRFNQDSPSDNLSYGTDICGDTMINGAAQPCKAATTGDADSS